MDAPLPDLLVIVRIETWTAATFDHILNFSRLSNTPHFDILFLANADVPGDFKTKCEKHRLRSGYGYQRIFFEVRPESRNFPKGPLLESVLARNYAFVMLLPEHIFPTEIRCFEKGQQYLFDHENLTLISGPSVCMPKNSFAKFVLSSLWQNPFFYGAQRLAYGEQDDGLEFVLHSCDFALVKTDSTIQLEPILMAEASQWPRYLSAWVHDPSLASLGIGCLACNTSLPKPFAEYFWADVRRAYNTIPHWRRGIDDPFKIVLLTHTLLFVLVTLMLILIACSQGVLHWVMIFLLMGYVITTFLSGWIYRSKSAVPQLAASVVAPFAIYLSGLMVLLGVFDFILLPLTQHTPRPHGSA